MKETRYCCSLFYQHRETFYYWVYQNGSVEDNYRPGDIAASVIVSLFEKSEQHLLESWMSLDDAAAHQDLQVVVEHLHPPFQNRPIHVVERFLARESQSTKVTILEQVYNSSAFTIHVPSFCDRSCQHAPSLVGFVRIYTPYGVW